MKRLGALIAATILVFLIAKPPQLIRAWVGEGHATGVDDARSGSVNKPADVEDTTLQMMLTVGCHIAVPDVPNPNGCSDDATQIPSLQKKSAVAFIGGAIEGLYDNPPADIALWGRDMASTLGFSAKPVYAQGIGFSGLTALLPLWKAFRNIAYALLALSLVIVGFLIMFRKKIDAQTVVTVQNSLPRIVLALILITFSYAIVGIAIDLMYLVYMLVLNIIVSASQGVFGKEYVNSMLSGTFMQTVGLVGRGMRSFDDIVRFINPRLFAGQPQGGVLGGILQGILTGVVEAPLIFVFMSLILLFASFRVFFMLLFAYIQIIVSLITGPLQILTEIFPGSNGFSNWLQNLVANLMVFPVTAALLTIGEFLARIGNTAITANGIGNNGPSIWNPPLIGAYGVSGTVGIVGLGILLSIPTLVNNLKEAMKVKPTVPMFAGVGQGGATAMQLVSTAYYIRALVPQKILQSLGFGGGGGAPGGHG